MARVRRPVAVVTGGAGFVGSHLCERLVADGYRVVCVDDFSTSSPANLAHLAAGPLDVVEQDVCEPLAVPGAVRLVAHLASPASPADYLRMPIQTLRTGSLGTLNALGLAQQRGARFLLASTSETYGDPLVHPQPESYWGNVNPVGPRAVYDEAKRFGEAATMAFRRHHQVDAAVMRVFNTYGPRMRRDDGRAIPAFIAAALDGRPLPVAGDGTQTRSICYVDDLVEGIVRLLASDLAGPVNLGNPYEISMRDLAGKICDLVGVSLPVQFVPRPQDDPEQRRPDISLARRELGWEPRVDPDEGLGATIAWFRSCSPERVSRPARGRSA